MTTTSLTILINSSRTSPGIKVSLVQNGKHISDFSTTRNMTHPFDDLAPGNYVAQAVAGGYLIGSQNASVTSGGTASVTFDLGAAGTISGLVTIDGVMPLSVTANTPNSLVAGS